MTDIFGRKVIICVYFYVNHTVNLLNRRFHSGIIIYVKIHQLYGIVIGIIKYICHRLEASFLLYV